MMGRAADRRAPLGCPSQLTLSEAAVVGWGCATEQLGMTISASDPSGSRSATSGIVVPYGGAHPVRAKWGCPYRLSGARRWADRSRVHVRKLVEPRGHVGVAALSATLSPVRASNSRPRTAALKRGAWGVDNPASRSLTSRLPGHQSKRLIPGKPLQLRSRLAIWAQAQSDAEFDPGRGRLTLLEAKLSKGGTSKMNT
jgi:hypothetical protein